MIDDHGFGHGDDDHAGDIHGDDDHPDDFDRIEVGGHDPAGDSGAHVAGWGANVDPDQVATHDRLDPLGPVEGDPAADHPVTLPAETAPDHAGAGVDAPAPSPAPAADDLGAAAPAGGLIEHVFPPHLDLAPVPADGREWVDPALLGGPGAVPGPDLGQGPGDPSADPGADPGTDPGAGLPVEAALPPHAEPAVLLADLHLLDAGDGTPSWAALANSDDPAVRALAQLWRPPG